MLKYLLIPSLLFIFLCLSCSAREDVKFDDKSDAAVIYNPQTDITSLGDIEELIDGLNYELVINNYKSKIEKPLIVRFRYFVIFSNLEPELTYMLIENDIRNTVTTMQKHYIMKNPDSVTAVFLFNDFDSYKDFSIKTFDLNAEDFSPYGFYKISRNAIAVRYVSWKGTLPHEITHSMIQPDFSESPSWFNEGMAALHEYAKFNNDRLVTSFSWRILSLRKSFRENSYTPLRSLMETNDDEFYSERSSYYYAQSCYLLMYLQDKGLLTDYYKLFRSNYEDDETGISQLETILNISLEKFEPEFITYVQSFRQQN
jgi:hypothetical protein